MAKNSLAEAQRQAAHGQPARAAKLYAEIASGNSSHADRAKESLHIVLSEVLASGSLQEADSVVEEALAAPAGKKAMADLEKKALNSLQKRYESDLESALRFLDRIKPLAKNSGPWIDLEKEILNAGLAKEPQRVEWACRLAGVYEREGNNAGAERLLEPLESELDAGEGARILGMIRVRQGRMEEAHLLLVPFLEAHAQSYVSAEENYALARNERLSLVEAEWAEGRAANFDYKAYEHASPADRKKMREDYFLDRLKTDPGLTPLHLAIATHSAAVKAALDLGLGLYQIVLNQPDAERQKSLLVKAEKALKCVKLLAGNSDEYRLNLAQVAFRLGHSEEARKLVDDLLTTHLRHPETLLAVGRTMAQAGDGESARKLFEEGYEKSDGEADKQKTALERALLAVDRDDAITWLGRCSESDPVPAALLTSAKGTKAVSEGRDDEARQLLRTALEKLAALPEDAITLTEQITACSSLYQLTGDRSALTKSIALLDRSLEKRPGDGRLALALAQTVQEDGLRELIGQSFEGKLFARRRSDDLVYFLFADKKTHAQLVERYQALPASTRVRNLLDRAATLMPGKVESYSSRLSLYQFTRDSNGLRRLHEQLGHADLDFKEVRRQADDYYEGKNDESNRRQLELLIENDERLLREASGLPKGATFAVAASTLVRNRIKSAVFGADVAADPLVKLAEEAYEIMPSQATHSTLQAALLFRANQTLARQDKDLAAMNRRAFRSLGPSYLLAIRAGDKNPPPKFYWENADFKKSIGLIQERLVRFPGEAMEWEWAMMRHASPETASLIARDLKKDKYSSWERQIRLLLAPPSLVDAYRVYWAHELAGEEAQGVKALKECAQWGVPLPVDLK